jgi:hypothetical protein
MDAKQIQTIAKDAVRRTREHHSAKVWDYVNPETRKGMVARTVVADFGAMGPDMTAADVAAVVKATDAIIDGD